MYPCLKYQLIIKLNQQAKIALFILQVIIYIYKDFENMIASCNFQFDNILKQANKYLIINNDIILLLFYLAV